MRKLTRLIAASLTSIVAVGVFGVPAAQAQTGNVEETLCDAYAPLQEDLEDLVAQLTGVLDDRQEAVQDAANDLESSSTAAGTAGLAYVRAIDTNGNTTGTLNAFAVAITQFSEDVADYIAAVDALDKTITDLSLNKAVLNYITNLCSGPAPTPSPTPTETASPTPSPSPTSGGLGDLLGDLLGGLLGGLGS